MRQRATWANLVVGLICLAAGGILAQGVWAQAAGERLRNGTFEGGSGGDGRGGGVPGWEPFQRGYEVDRQTHHGGEQCVRCDSLNPTTERGAQATLVLNQTRPAAVAIAGWSRADQVSGGKGDDYSLYVDAQYTDGTFLYGTFAPFRAGTHGWQKRQVVVQPVKPLKSLTVIALFRNRTGTVWFDDFSARVLTGAGIFDAQPLAFPLKTAGPSVSQVASRDGLALGFDTQGAITTVKAGRQSLHNAHAGGFYIRDVAAEGGLAPLRGTPKPRKAGGINIGGIVNSLHVVFNCAVFAEGDALSIDGELTDTTKQDRAVTVYCALPVGANGWLWGDDVRRARALDSEGEFTNQTRISVGATGGLSLYPYASVASPSGGVALLSQMDWPSVVRLFYNGPTHQFVIAWDMALTGKTAAWPSHNARFRCRLARLPAGPPDEAFRQATLRFYALNAPNFERRTQAAGIWMPFTDPANVPNAQDFGFAFHEGDNSLKTDDAAGILSFRYSEAQTTWLPLPPDVPRTYANALAALERDAASTDPAKRDVARAVLNSGSQDEAGLLNLQFENAPWTNGAVFVVNPNPELPSTPDKPTRASVLYTVPKAMQMYGPEARATRGEQDGEYLDSLEAWADVQDYRPAHLAATPYPIPFDVDSRKPCVPEWYSTHAFARYLRDDLHNRSKLLMANSTPDRFAIFAALWDVAGIETNWLNEDGTWHPDSDAIFNLRRTLSHQKPYLLLMNSDYDRWTPALVEKYFERSLFYGVFPSMFSHNAADKPYWENPAWYNRDRSLFRKYVPLLKQLSAAGWEVLPHARTDNAAFYVERWGTRLFTLLNDSATSRDVTLTVDLRALNLTGVLTATDLIANTVLPAKPNGTALVVTLTLAPQQAALVRLH